MLTAVAAPATVFSDLRAREFSRLDDQGHAYLDYTGSALYGTSQLRFHHALMEESVFGNPHADSGASRGSTAIITEARRTVLRFLDVDESTHAVCFTANATAAIKLVAESYPFGPQSPLILSADNHNSMNGIREYAQRAGAAVRVLPLDGELRLREPETILEEGGGLLAFPAQSNFSGVQHPLGLVAKARALGMDVLLDIAAYVPSNAFSLQRCPADFVVLSFYKLFGYPTGVGALVARRDALQRLRRPWFSGGTVLWASTALGTHRLRATEEAFEDGTPDFLGLAALAPGFALLDEVQMPRLTDHVRHLTSALLEGLRALCHANGVALVRIYGPQDLNARGGTVAFNVCDASGTPIAYPEVEARARSFNMSLRGGCFCNPGTSEAAFELEPEETAACLDESGAAFTPERLATCTGRPVGAIRASVGLANNDSDIRRVIAAVASFAQ